MIASVSGRLMTLRASVVRSIQSRLASVGPRHPIRRLHAALRRIPGIKFVWHRVLGAGSRDWFEIAAYRRQRGQFAPSAIDSSRAADAATDPNASAYPGFAFMDRLARAASLHEPAYVPLPGRIVLVNCSLAAGGAERQVVATLKGLRRRGLAPVFIGEFIEGGHIALDFYLPALRAAGIEAVRADPGPLAGPAFYADVTEPVAIALSMFEPEPVTRMIGMARHLRRLRPQVVHLWQDQTSVLHGMAALIARVPRIVLSGRNVDPTHFDYFRTWLQPGYRMLAAQPHVVITNNSQAGAVSYARWLGLPCERIRVILNAAELPQPMAAVERDAARAALGVADSGFLVVGVMRMSPEKQPLLWVETAAEIARLRPEAQFVIAGDGPMMDVVLSRVRALGLSERIQFTGEVSDVRSIQGAADVLLLTSAQEGTPNVLLEAQALETPVVTTDAGGAAACLVPGRTGLVIDRSRATPRSLAQAVLEATLLGPAMRSRGLGRDHVSSTFAEDEMLGATLHAYGDLTLAKVCAGIPEAGRTSDSTRWQTGDARLTDGLLQRTE